jgi:hypothetical protein
MFPSNKKKITSGARSLCSLAQIFVITLTVMLLLGTSAMAANDLGTSIQAAKKYRAVQVTDADVMLVNPDLYALLQSDNVTQAVDRFRAVGVSENAKFAPAPHILEPDQMPAPDFVMASRQLLNDFKYAPTPHILEPDQIPDTDMISSSGRGSLAF